MQPLKTLSVPKSGAYRQTSSMYMARLMPPEAVAAATSARPLPHADAIRTRWMLCGEVSAPMFERLRAGTDAVQARVSAFRSSHRGTYLVFTHQVETYQHRFLLALYDPSVIRCFEGLTRGHGFVLGNDEGKEAIILQGAATEQELRPIKGFFGKPDVRQLRDFISEIPLVVAALAAPDAIPSLCDGEQVQEVSLSLLMPDECLQRLHAGRGN